MQGEGRRRGRRRWAIERNHLLLVRLGGRFLLGGGAVVAVDGPPGVGPLADQQIFPGQPSKEWPSSAAAATAAAADAAAAAASGGRGLSHVHLLLLLHLVVEAVRGVVAPEGPGGRRGNGDGGVNAVMLVILLLLLVVRRGITGAGRRRRRIPVDVRGDGGAELVFRKHRLLVVLLLLLLLLLLLFLVLLLLLLRVLLVGRGQRHLNGRRRWYPGRRRS